MRYWLHLPPAERRWEKIHFGVTVFLLAVIAGIVIHLIIGES